MNTGINSKDTSRISTTLREGHREKAEFQGTSLASIRWGKNQWAQRGKGILMITEFNKPIYWEIIKL